ncbi:hypothetical protein L3X38_004917 [Prunus dulcis]|uniref:Protein FAR1-RELATED SEQUENCE n=1 Tax=Prunus dulcis TaxID=3755 RepID=A0AAD4ZQ11_PRUDU|nr:hypothetical protein L3X38_004917 [Prunus dulcis]
MGVDKQGTTEELVKLTLISKKLDGDEKNGSFKLKVREVMVDKVVDYASCICKKFEFEGILCRHVLAYMKMKQTEYLSNKYILKRRTRAAKSDIVMEEGGMEITECDDNSLLIRQTRLSKLAFELIDGGIRGK